MCPDEQGEIIQFLNDVRQLSGTSSPEQLRLVSIHDTHIHVDIPASIQTVLVALPGSVEVQSDETGESQNIENEFLQLTSHTILI